MIGKFTNLPVHLSSLFLLLAIPLHAESYDLTINFTGMTPHVGQLLELRVVDSLSGMTVADTAIASVASADFQISFSGVLQEDKSYSVDFFADLNKNGAYDSPPADHAWRMMIPAVSGNVTLAFAHNTQFTDVRYPANLGPFDLTLNFINMTPHVGQLLQLRVLDMSTGYLAAETTLVAVPSANFQLAFSQALQAGRSYDIDFYADLNKNGNYDTPSADHAWRLTTEDVSDNVALDFTHNTSFTDIMFPPAVEPYDLTVVFSGMTPHVGQLFALRAVDSLTGMTVADTMIAALAGPDFVLSFMGRLWKNHSYYIDFYADLNKNGMYDAPSADHAWRMMASDVQSNKRLTFAHNTKFTDVKYPASLGPFDLTLNFTGMTPHVGVLFKLRVLDSSTLYVVADTSIDNLAGPDFMLAFAGKLQVNRSYNIDFYADHNKNGTYNTPPADHAWRMAADMVADNVSLDFAHNTNFTDVEYPASPGPFDLEVDFTNMTPHLGQLLALRAVDSLTGMPVADTTIAALDTANFSIKFEDVLPKGNSYYIDFYADLNKNGTYDAPPADHAWRLMASMVSGHVKLAFTHNTSFTDVMFPSAGGPFGLTLDFTGMTPHVGQMLELRVVDIATGYEAGQKTVTAIETPAFQIMLPGILQAGRSYNVDFYADFNKNGVYDAPTKDHAWRLESGAVSDDVMLSFAHNTSFTDIMYPVPACACDFNGDGMADITDIADWAMDMMENINNRCLDWNGDGMVKINDAVLMLADIRAGNCPEQMSPMLAGSAIRRSSGSRVPAALKPEQVEYLNGLAAQLKLTPEEKAAFLNAIFGTSGTASLPKAFALDQNRPNPFNPSTTISFSVPEGKAGQVTLKVFDVRGRLVRTLSDQVRDAGSYTLFWDGTDESGRQVASGVYFYRMQAGGFTQIRKMVLLK